MIKILDSTLREGEQTPGVYFSADKKMRIAEFLDQIGVDIIEAGNPAVDSEIALAITKIVQAGFKSKIAAHSLCNIDNVQKVLDCGVDFLGVFFSVSQKRLDEDYHISLEAAIDKITNVVSFARKQNPNLLIRYTPEDAVRSPIKNIIAASSAAVQAGVNIISIADTTGYSNPFDPQRSMYFYVKTLKEELKKQNLHPQIEVHCHNDKGLALANALDAYRGGAHIIDVTTMGLGERAGIVDLAQLLINLIDMGEDEKSWQLQYLQDLYRFVSENSQIPLPPHQPIMGNHAFTHYAGVHVKAIAKNQMLYQSIHPEILGIKSKFALGIQSGYAAIEMAVKQIGREDLLNNQDLVIKMITEVKLIAKQGNIIDIEKELPLIIQKLLKHYS